MLNLEDFKKFEVIENKDILGGTADFWGHSYTCIDGSGGFSTIGPDIHADLILERCGEQGATIERIY